MRGGAGRVPDHEPDGHLDARRCGLARDAGQEILRRADADLAGRNVHRRQRGTDLGGEVEIVESRDRDVLGNAKALARAFDEGAEGEQVVAAEDGRGGLRCIEERPQGQLPLDDPVGALDERLLRQRKPALREDGSQPFEPSASAVVVAGDAGDHAEALVAEIEKVRRDPARGGRVVEADARHVLRQGPGDDVGDAPLLQEAERLGIVLRAHQHHPHDPVGDLGLHLVEFAVPVVAAASEDEAVAGVPQPLLHRLGRGGEIGVLEMRDDRADDGRPPKMSRAPHALRRVAQPLGGLLYAAAQLGRDGAAAVQRARHGDAGDGERADVVIAIDDAMDRLAQDGVIRADTRIPVARAMLGVAAKAGAPRPDIASVDAFKRSLVEARGVACSIAGASGIYFRDLIERLGIADAVNTRAVTIPAGFTATKVASGEADLAIQQISELMSVEGVDIVGPFPEEVQAYTSFSAAIFTDARNPAGAARLLEALESDEAIAAYGKGGLASLVRARPAA